MVDATVGDVSWTFTNTGLASAIFDAGASTCDDGGTDNLDADGKCTIVFTSNGAGTTTVNASVTLTVAGVSVTRDTDPGTAGILAGPGGTGPADKDWVDAEIILDPLTDTNEVGQPHTVTVEVNKDPGTGMVDATVGDVSWTFTDGGGAVAIFDAGASTCDDGGTDNLDADGKCTIVFTSNGAGTTTVNAAVTLTVGGVPLTRDTAGDSGPNGTGPANKTWVAFKLLIITCTMDDDLVKSGVRLDSTDKDTIAPADVTALAAALDKTVPQVEAILCNLGGAQYDNLPSGIQTPSVDIDDPLPWSP